MTNITVTKEAEDYLVNLVNNNPAALGVKLFVTKPGTPKAETMLTYCKSENINEDDDLKQFADLKIYLSADSLEFLEDAHVHFDKDMMGGSLTIKAPNSKLPNLGENATLEQKVNYVIWNDVYPMVAPHGGEVNLVEITEYNVAVLSFGGGCQGCSQVSVTLKYGVEEQLLASVPELTGVRDVTDHTDQSTSYYK